MSQLEFATTPELLDELISRFEHAVFIGRPLNEANVVDRRFKGSDSMLIGMMDLACDELRIEHRKALEKQ